MLSCTNLTEWVKMIIEESGIIRELEQEGTVEAKTRVENYS